MPMQFLIPAGMSLIGGLMGSEEKTTGKVNPTSQTTNSSGSSSTQHKLDPRMEQAIYGAGGIMPNAAAWYAQNQSGLNNQMLTGLNNQWNQLGASGQGFNQMQNLGMGLMGGGVAGNPFTGSGGISPQQLSYSPASMASGSFNNTTNPFTMPAATAQAPAMLGGAGGGGGGGGGESQASPLGAAMAAMGSGAPAPNQGVWIDDTEGGGYWSNGGGNAGASAYHAPYSSYQSIVPTGSSAGYGGYGGYSTLPAYSYPSGGNGGE